MRLTIVCLFAFYAFGARAQVDIVNTNLTKPEISHLYVGIDNPIKIKGKPGVKYGLISSSGTSIQKTAVVNEFRLLAISRAGYDTLKVTLAGKVIYKEVFNIKTIPYPIVRAGNITKDKVTTAELLAQPMLTVFLPDCYLNLSYRIQQFTFYWSKGKSETCTGPDFSQNLILIINKLKPGDVVYFEDIHLKGGPDDGPRALPIKLTIR
jgi:hypothetical protein